MTPQTATLHTATLHTATLHTATLAASPTLAATPARGAQQALAAVDALQVLAHGVPLLVGQYGVDLEAGRWWWSPEVDAMHGWDPGDVEPGPAALRARTHPDDRDRLVRTVGQALRRRRPYSGSHRIVDTHGKVRTLVVTGEGRPGADGRVAELVGHVVDVTPVLHAALDRELTRAVKRAVASAGTVEQAKGMVMAADGVDEPTATRLLVDAAHAGGVGVGDAAAHVVSAVLRAGQDAGEAVDPALARVAATEPGARRPDKAPRLTRRQSAR